MAIQKHNLGRSVDIVLSINGMPLGGQQGATLVCSSSPIEITNKINGEWSEHLAGKKSWNIVCSGFYIVNDSAFQTLVDAFMNNLKIKAKIVIGSQHLEGEALIIDFPLNAVFNKEFKYTVKLLGTGELKKG